MNAEKAEGYIVTPKRFLCPLHAALESDGNGYIARTAEIPLYGSGDTPEEAVDMLKREIESLYEDLQENDQFTEEWLRIKSFLTDSLAGSILKIEPKR